MIDLYTWTTPNGRKVSILLEELGVPYTVHSINIGQDEQFLHHRDPRLAGVDPSVDEAQRDIVDAADLHHGVVGFDGGGEHALERPAGRLPGKPHGAAAGIADQVSTDRGEPGELGDVVVGRRA